MRLEGLGRGDIPIATLVLPTFFALAIPRKLDGQIAIAIACSMCPLPRARAWSTGRCATALATLRGAHCRQR
eukprot:5512899-Alexandrium_andersonii.AAC.1